jgi:hypothetical protein
MAGDYKCVYSYGRQLSNNPTSVDMRSFCIFVFALFLVVLTAALPLQPRVIPPGLVYVLEGLIADSGEPLARCNSA